MIPLNATGRDPIFLYGTLTDRHVLTRVLRRPLAAGDLASAGLLGFRRLQALGASYPLLIPAPDSLMPGLLLRRATRRDIVRINHFESGEYRAERHTIRLEDGSTCEAWLYMGLPDFVASEETWELAAWQERHKEGFLALCEEWMADCPEPD